MKNLLNEKKGTSQHERLEQLQRKVIDNCSSTDDDEHDSDDSSDIVQIFSMPKIIIIDSDHDLKEVEYDDDDEEKNLPSLDKLPDPVLCSHVQKCDDKRYRSNERSISQGMKSMSLIIAISIVILVGLETMFIYNVIKKRMNTSKSPVQIDLSVYSNNYTDATSKTTSYNKLTDMNKTSWPELMNIDLPIAISVIQSQRPDITIIYVISDFDDHSSITSSDRTAYEYDNDYEISYQVNRVRLQFVDGAHQNFS